MPASMRAIFGFFLLLVIFIACAKRNATTPLGSHQDSSSVQVVAKDTIPASISIISGDGQFALKGSRLPQDLVVVVKNNKGQPLAGISVSFISTGVQNGGIYEASPMTNTDGIVDVFWVLGTQSDTNQSFTARVSIDTNLSVTFHATGRDLKRYNFIGTIRIVDTSGRDQLNLYGGPPDFPALSFNTDMPFMLDSLILDSLALPGYPYSLPPPPDSVIINGHSLVGGNTFYAGNKHLYVLALEDKSYPNCTQGQLCTYSMEWDFTGTIVNNVYSGNFNLIIHYSFRGAPNATSPGEVYQNGDGASGIFSTTLQ
jgi:hypothetical protein